MSSRPGTVQVAGGELRGRRLEVSRGVRPSSGVLREALASIWQGRIPGARVLDLFAGSGAVGIEMMSRGAARATFVEQDARVCRVLVENLRRAEEGEERRRSSVIRASAVAALRRLTSAGDRFDLVFADPPYRFTAFGPLLAALSPVLAEGAGVAVEHAARARLDQPFGGALVLVGTRRYGDSALSLLDAIGD